MPYTYPANDYDRRGTLLGLLGSFWTNVYQGSALTEELVHAQAQLEAQAHLTLLELAASVSRFDVPVFHTRNWHMLTLVESDLNTGSSAIPTYDGTLTYGGGHSYGQPLSLPQSAWDLPSGMKDGSLVMNRITRPSVTMVKDVDYQITDDSIIFRDNPFDNPLIPKRDIYVGDAVTDRELALWVFRGSFDWQNVYNQFGYVLELFLESGDNYRTLVNAIFDAMVQGTTVRHIRTALSAMTDIPLVIETQETVEQLLTDANRKLVVTDQHVYEFSVNDTFEVEVGDLVEAGDTLTTGLGFFDFGDGSVPASTVVSGVALGRGLLTAGFFAELVFENEDKALVVETDDDGYTRLSWEISGWPGDVEEFFDSLHARGLAEGQTLAHLLDERTNKVGEPGASNLPATINPLEFLCENIFRNHAFLVTVEASSMGRNALGFNSAKILRKIIPPQTLMILAVELAHSDDPIIMDSAGDATSPGYVEAMNLYLALKQTESIGPGQMDERVTLRQIAGRCL
jgi:hypothetical protein